MSVHGSKLGKPHEALERMMQSIFDCRRNGTEDSCCRQGWGGQERTESCPSAALSECKAGPSRRRGSPQSAASARTARKPAGRGSCTRLQSRCVQRNRCFPNRRLRFHAGWPLPRMPPFPSPSRDAALHALRSASFASVHRSGAGVSSRSGLRCCQAQASPLPVSKHTGFQALVFPAEGSQ